MRRLGRRRILLALAVAASWTSVAAAPSGCGGRTPLIVLPPPSEASVVDTARPDVPAPVDAQVEAEASADVAEEDVPVDTAPDTADAPQPCMAATDCTETTFCKPSATCGPSGTCVYAARDCDDGVACTNDQCNEDAMKCVHAPDDTLCPDTELCSPTRGCDAFVYAVGTDNFLYEVDVPSGALTQVGGMIGAFASDIALASDGTLYLTDSYDLYTVDRASATSVEVAPILPLHMYAGLGTFPMAGAPLYTVADTNQVFSVDPMAGASNPVASLPAGLEPDGDLSAVNGTLYVALLGQNGTTDTLASVDVSGMTITPIGDTGSAHLYGLATLGGVLYGLSSTGEIVTIDTATGTAQSVAMDSTPFQGAAGR
jgi:hypothetical protein